MVWDFAADSNPFAFAFAAFALTFPLTFAFADGNLEGLPGIADEQVENLQQIWSPLKAEFGQASGQAGDIWANLVPAGESGFQISLGGLSEDSVAQILSIVRREAENKGAK